MFTGETLSDVLHAIATGFLDRARSLTLMSEELDDDERERLQGIVYDETASPVGMVRALGDAIREMGCDRALANECYRLAFYLGDEATELTKSDLYTYFLAHRSGRLLDKWVHYFPIYERHLSAYRGLSPSVLEIGVYHGGSLEMWRRYLGSGVKLTGIDIDPTAAQLADPSLTIILGDQADATFLTSVRQQHGPFDIVIDDGGHTMEQQITSIETLFPHLNEGGLYIVEDCHTSYWEDFDGGPGRPGTFIEWTKTRVDDLHRYHRPEPVEPIWTDQVAGIHCYDSVVVFEKHSRFAPFNEQVGASEFLYFQRPTSVLVGEMLATRDAAITKLAQLEAPAGDELRLARGEVAQLLPRNRELEAELERLNEELMVTRNDLLETSEQVRAMRKTISWRITAPLRSVRRRRGSGR